MLFYTGIHHPSKAHRLKRAFVSANALWNRKSPMLAWRWILDSGAFSEILRYGRYRDSRSVSAYAERIEQWRWQSPLMIRAVQQDYMCEPDMLAKTGATVEHHQAWTIERYLALKALSGDIVMPCLQGYVLDDYLAHIVMWGDELPDDIYIGVGSVCKRKNEQNIAAILRAIKAERPGWRLHGFGLKKSSLASAEVCDLLESADSMAWSFAARYEGRDPNCWREAKRWGDWIQSMPKQESLL